MKRPEELVFEPPGPGLWQVDGLHTPKPITALKQSTYLQIPIGMKAGMSRYGLLAQGIEIAVLHRFVYATPNFLVYRPAGDDEHARRLFEEEAAANPELQERFERAKYAMTNKRWRQDREHWDNVGRPWLLGRTLALTDEDPLSMDAAALTSHISECLYHLGRTNQYHHLLNVTAGLPRSLLFSRLVEWTGKDPHELEPLMVGSSPISAGDEPEMRDLVDALEKDAGAVAAITSEGDPRDILNMLAERRDDVGNAYRAFARMVGFRTLDGWEPMNPYVLESPALMLDKIRHGLTRQYAGLDEGFLQEIREQVPPGCHDEFDELFEDARANSRIRDERDLYCNVPVSGVLRRGVIEAGRRAADKGLIDDVEHMTEASMTEIVELVTKNRDDLAAELADRYAYRQAYSIEDIPDVIGSPEPGLKPVPPEWLPQHLATMIRASGVTAALNVPMQDEPSEPAHEVIKGRGVSPGVYQGVARVVTEAREIDSIKHGEVLVTRSTSPSFNVVLPRLGAIVTQYGGVLSHAAIVAREFGLPGIVGCKDVLKKVATGDRVTVDGDRGELTIHR